LIVKHLKSKLFDGFLFFSVDEVCRGEDCVNIRRWL